MLKNRQQQILLVVVILLSFFLGRVSMYQSTNKKSVSETKPNAQTIKGSGENLSALSEEDETRQLAERFEQLQIDKKATDVLLLFTPPQTKKEADDYLFILGMDLFNEPSPNPRLYLTNGLQSCIKSYSIKSIIKSENKYIATADESRCVYDNSTGKQWEEKQTMIIEVVRVGARPMIDRYYSDEGELTKYAGFYL
ncbi:MAG: hypothetical protein UV61_C0001G0090 [Candidatus Gottesmanbacteria bacterium GW2011_GWB1_43_11]|uniref:Uncharacterized protein n=1 Tax=Candidatus Gottesmanbacteria bacterium GW2011_GWB1_43_11 TaxID=1618446 RepID=A0A0G1FLA7_9BACT|nr:MAG: hypothetical protein UV04_C0004G0032 [Candidatus Gottesmanbacteria bacterium GW2011_GWA2_42_16]KKS56055.1 MAG: hypothetical protein UV17_C0003G0027 [Candidatus Gottesmanbacteria bacterium GW2011_GWA1_42_26]KKS81633.1 MAG: hypothetical protein UV55_C0011G0027 [Candidatus Gottesmanbacteria bacterium GW2011_GWC1_43_10]KKS87683.1 MAG: hypothetical protein UV61_C0001G0090 [Candidatus Gottesmanbacteria bacterium GW2011_GWB1_43_11]OGG07498.1 MAG: hypothetical protein A2699_00430 [Candidatus Go